MNSDLNDLDHNPMQHFQQWFYEVEKLDKTSELNAMILTTDNPKNHIKNRIVLLKKFTWEGFIFFTNYNSEKGIAIENNNKISLHFNWYNAKKEIIIKGIASKISKELSENYFELRPEGSKLSNWVSKQGEIIPSRKYLHQKLEKYHDIFKGIQIPKPDYWGGYLVSPLQFDFIDTSHQEYAINEKYNLQKNHLWNKKTSYSIPNI